MSPRAADHQGKLSSGKFKAKNRRNLLVLKLAATGGDF